MKDALRWSSSLLIRTLATMLLSLPLRGPSPPEPLCRVRASTCEVTWTVSTQLSLPETDHGVRVVSAGEIVSPTAVCTDCSESGALACLALWFSEPAPSFPALSELCNLGPQARVSSSLDVIHPQHCIACQISFMAPVAVTACPISGQMTR